ncbi:hypothetical protein IW262DRAFT_359134 [Armillaria fumosa]|nr:hypothetical protein IW262DRAFT_359134 [Armillaria fumosa]
MRHRHAVESKVASSLLFIIICSLVNSRPTRWPSRIMNSHAERFAGPFRDGLPRPGTRMHTKYLHAHCAAYTIAKCSFRPFVHVAGAYVPKGASTRAECLTRYRKSR